MERPFPSYNGDGPYIFVSYSHDDADIVYPGITWLRDQGFNIWYDEGISPGASWREELAEAILKCDLFVILVSPRSAKSHNCLKEVNFALEHNRQILAIHQEPTELSPGLQLALSDRQAIFRHELNDEQYRDKILAGVKSHIQPSGQGTQASFPPSINRPANRKPLLAAATVAGVLAVVAVGYTFLKEEATEDITPIANEQPSEPVSNQDVKVRSDWIAVLPFTILSGGEEMRSMAAGLTPQMIRSLQPISRFSIVNYRTVEPYRDRSTDIGEIARTLNVRYFVDGSIQRSGDRTRIGIELVDGILGKSLWQDTLNFEGNDYLAMQDEISLLTTRILSSRMDSFEMERLATLPREELTADELQVRSGTFWLDPSQDHLDKAVADLRQVLEINPKHTLAMANLAHFLSQEIQWGGAEDPVTTSDEACAFADRAISLARDDQAIGVVAYPLSDVCNDAEKAVQVLERLIELNPESATMWPTYSYALLSSGQPQAALDALERGHALDSEGLWVWYLEDAFRATVYASEGQWNKTIELATKAVNENPGLYWLRPTLANAYGMTGDFDAARTQWNLVKRRFPKATVGRLRWLYSRGPGGDDFAEQALGGLRRAGIE